QQIEDATKECVNLQTESNNLDVDLRDAQDEISSSQQDLESFDAQQASEASDHEDSQTDDEEPNLPDIDEADNSAVNSTHADDLPGQIETNDDVGVSGSGRESQMETGDTHQDASNQTDTVEASSQVDDKTPITEAPVGASDYVQASVDASPQADEKAPMT